MTKWRLASQPYLFIFPSAILMLVFSVYPIIWVFRFMFYEYLGYGVPKFTGLYNFERLFRDTQFWDALVNTLVFSSGKLLLTIPIALIIAVILNTQLRGRNLLRVLYFMPTVISIAVMSVVFYIIFNSYNGILNQYLIKFGIISQNIQWLSAKHAMLTVVLVATWGAIGNNMLLFLAGLQGIPRDVYESAEIDGANFTQKFWYITIPMLGPVLQVIMMLAIIASLKGYEGIMVLTGGGPAGTTEVMYLYLFKLLFPISAGGPAAQEIGYGSAVGFAISVIVGIITAVYFFLSKKLNQAQ
jgi:raffinose/stachyose/melibiose transport system permease protein